MPAKSGTFVLRKNVKIGQPAAEQDSHFLQNCFVDSGILDMLKTKNDPHRIVSGRTGSGKSALLLKLLEDQNSIEISPESLALGHIANSNIISFFEKAGVNLKPFYKLLWKHVFVVELLRMRYHIVDSSSRNVFLTSIAGLFKKDDRKKAAMEYLNEYGTKFWETTESRVKEITKTFEDKLGASVGMEVGPLPFKAGGSSTLSEEQRLAVTQRGQEVVNQIQLRKLNDVMEAMRDDILTDQQQYYLVIDGLDEGWVDETIRFQLIRALMDVAIEFKKVRQVKVILGMRTDLLELVLANTRDVGFQEEKYTSLCLTLGWTKQQLVELVDLRITQLVKDHYTSASVTHEDLLPSIQGRPGIQYMLDRTLLRPRDIIMFFNLCFEECDGDATITRSKLLAAEAKYSQGRLAALKDEWSTSFPCLIEFAELLRGRKVTFKLNDLTDEFLFDAFVQIISRIPISSGVLYTAAKDFCETKINGDEMRRILAEAFYRIGLVAIKPTSQDPFQWAIAGPITLSPPFMDENAKLRVHPMFWRRLGIIGQQTSSE